MAVIGKQREQTEERELFVGFTAVKVVAVNPSKAEMNKLVGREDSEDDKEQVYLGSDLEGNDRLRLAFWLQDLKTDKLYVHSFNITNKERKNKDGTKVQLINCTCDTSWAPYVEGTDKIDDALIPDWFSNFTEWETKKILGPKKYRKALAGEEELGTLLKAWLGRVVFSAPETEVLIDTKKLFKENYKELREIISLDENGQFTQGNYDTPFVVLLGVRTDEKDPSKKYQQVWSKGFLSYEYLKYINNGGDTGPKFLKDNHKRTWKKFKEDVLGDYGFDGYTELVPLVKYDVNKDLAGGREITKEVPAPQSSDY